MRQLIATMCIVMASAVAMNEQQQRRDTSPCDSRGGGPLTVLHEHHVDTVASTAYGETNGTRSEMTFAPSDQSAHAIRGDSVEVVLDGSYGSGGKVIARESHSYARDGTWDDVRADTQVVRVSEQSEVALARGTVLGVVTEDYGTAQYAAALSANVSELGAGRNEMAVGLHIVEIEGDDRWSILDESGAPAEFAGPIMTHTGFQVGAEEGYSGKIRWGQTVLVRGGIIVSVVD